MVKSSNEIRFATSRTASRSPIESSFMKQQKLLDKFYFRGTRPRELANIGPSSK